MILLNAIHLEWQNGYIVKVTVNDEGSLTLRKFRFN